MIHQLNIKQIKTKINLKKLNLQYMTPHQLLHPQPTYNKPHPDNNSTTS